MDVRAVGKNLWSFTLVDGRLGPRLVTFQDSHHFDEGSQAFVLGAARQFIPSVNTGFYQLAFEVLLCPDGLLEIFFDVLLVDVEAKTDRAILVDEAFHDHVVHAHEPGEAVLVRTVFWVVA